MTDFAALMPEVTKRLLGEPNAERSTKTELRFGTHGSLSVDLQKGRWFDHEAQKGGGVLDLIKRQGHDPRQWLIDNGLIEANRKQSRIVATYDYQDENGARLFQVVRFEPKDFRQRQPDPTSRDGWKWKRGGRIVPYRLPELIDAVAQERPIFICEGEKDADNGAAFGLDTTTNPGGAGKWDDAFADYLRGADCIIVAHNDEPGRHHAEHVARSLIGKARRVRVLTLPDLADKGDLSDWIKAGGTAEQFYELVEHAPDYREPEDGWNFHTETITPIDYLIRDILPKDGHGLLSGQWGMLKTTCALDLSLCIMSGQPFAGKYPVRLTGGVAYFALEGSGGLLPRLTGIEHARGLKGALPFIWRKDCPALTQQGACDELLHMVEQAQKKMQARFGVPLRLAWIDTMVIASAYQKSGEDNDAAITQMVLSVLSKVAGKTGVLMMGVEHFGKATETGTRGSSTKEGSADVVLAMIGDRALNGSISNLKLAVRKVRDGASGFEIPCAVRRFQTGIDQYGDAITRPVLDWNVEPDDEPKSDWPQALRKLRRIVMSMMADNGKDVFPFLDGPMVRACDLNLVRAEFYKQHPAEGPPKKQQATKQKAFKRALDAAEAAGLICFREVKGTDLIWLTTPKTAPADRDPDI